VSFFVCCSWIIPLPLNGDLSLRNFRTAFSTTFRFRSNPLATSTYENKVSGAGGGGDSKIASLKLHPERVVCDMGCVPIGKQSTPMASISQPGSGKHIHFGHLLKLGFKNCGHLLQEKMQRVSNTTSEDKL